LLYLSINNYPENLDYKCFKTIFIYKKSNFRRFDCLRYFFKEINIFYILSFFNTYVNKNVENVFTKNLTNLFDVILFTLEKEIKVNFSIELSNQIIRHTGLSLNRKKTKLFNLNVITYFSWSGYLFLSEISKAHIKYPKKNNI
jgi:hypothetical protein